MGKLTELSKSGIAHQLGIRLTITRNFFYVLASFYWRFVAPRLEYFAIILHRL